MSEMELHTGTCYELCQDIEGFKDKIDIAVSVGFSVEDIDYDNEYFYSDRLCWANGKLYVIENNQHDPFGACEAEKLDDGSYRYFLYYYNGGASFSEAFSDAIKNVKENQ